MYQNTTQYLKIHQNVSFICAKKFTIFFARKSKVRRSEQLFLFENELKNETFGVIFKHCVEPKTPSQKIRI